MKKVKRRKSKNRLWSIIKKYRWRSVFIKYLTSLLLIILVIFIPYNIFIYIYFDYVLQKEISDRSTTNALKSKDIFDLLSREFFVNISIAGDSAPIINFLSSDGTSKDLDDSINLINAMTSASQNIMESFLYSKENDVCISSNQLTPLENLKEINWLNTYKSTRLPLLIFPRKNKVGVFDCIYVCSEIYDKKGNVSGVFCSKISYTSFTDIIKKSFEEEPEKIFIVSDIGLILYSDQPELINTLMFEREDIYSIFKSARSVEGNTIFIDNHIISVAKSTSSQLMLMSYSDRVTMGKNYSRIYTLLLVGGVTVLIVSALIAFYVSYRYYASIASIVEKLSDPDNIDNIDNHTLTNTDLLGEFFYISHTISGMSQKNQSMENELAEKLVTLKKAQIEALQAQINPHFLFNTLQLINFSIIKEIRSDNSATKLISLLSNLMHSSYDTDNFIVTVDEEIQNALQYIEIQKARYKSKLEVVVEIDRQCLQFKTIKLILQPFIENSIVHGLRSRSSGWRITVRCFQEGNNVVFELSDNGTGIFPDVLDRLNLSLRQIKSYRHGSVGISNVNKRLKLVFGSQSSISIHSTTAGTVVTLTHPATESLEVN